MLQKDCFILKNIIYGTSLYDRMHDLIEFASSDQLQIALYYHKNRELNM